jgi:hypothetical protein
VAYRLDLPAYTSIHPVFHVSQLKQAVSKDAQVCPTLPADVDLLRVPEAILQKRMVARGARSVHQGLVRWSGSPDFMATWEDLGSSGFSRGGECYSPGSEGRRWASPRYSA